MYPADYHYAWQVTKYLCVCSRLLGLCVCNGYSISVYVVTYSVSVYVVAIQSLCM